uniref:F-box domain-containing protein n=1 Tax=Ananas comosus var. bracteatus TaxID=296719 RepID=A0A6V7PDK6_ANACO|nr:unnamed protein product [Ananas comosus var. bracteatus]
MIKPLPFDGDGESGNELWAPFPSDILTHIASKLTAADYASARAACKSWRAVFSSVAAPAVPTPLPFLLPALHPPRSPPPPQPYPALLRLPPRPHRPLSPRRLNRCYTNSPIFPLGSVRNPRSARSFPLRHRPPRLRRLFPRLAHPPRSHLPHLPPQPPHRRHHPLPPPLSSVRYLFPVSDPRDVDQHLLSPPHQPRRSSTSPPSSASPPSPPTPPTTPRPSSSSSSSERRLLPLLHLWPERQLRCVEAPQPAQVPAYGLTDLIFHHGRCFAAITWSYSGRSLHGPADAIAVFDFHTYPAFQRLLHVRIRENYVAKNYTNFLIESAGELLLVTRHGEINAGRILVHRLPPLEGDVQARDFRRFIRRNCVYFTDVYRKVVNDRAVSVGCVYVFDMEKGITRKAFEVAQEHEMNMWSNLRPWSIERWKEELMRDFGTQPNHLRGCDLGFSGNGNRQDGVDGARGGGSIGVGLGLSSSGGDGSGCGSGGVGQLGRWMLWQRRLQQRWVTSVGTAADSAGLG